MIRNSLKIALRNFYKKPAFSIINVLGLAIGLACFVLTMVYVSYELSYDNFHKHKGRIFVVTSTVAYEDSFIENQTSTPALLAEELRTNFPEILTSTKIMGPVSFVIKHNDNLIKEDNFQFVDSTFFDVFSYEFIEGSPVDAFSNRNDMVITESIAKKYFGEEKAYGKVLTSVDRASFKITGVIKDPPKNSVIRIDMLVSALSVFGSQQWNENYCQTYIVLKKGIDPLQLETKFPALIKSKIPQIQGQDIESWLEAGNRWEYHLLSLKDIYLVLEGNRIYVFGFGIVAMFLLIIACINYMNLSTARASTRAKEVGVRMAVGALRSNLIRQFIGESMLMSLLSLIIGMGMVEAVLPALSVFIGKDLSVHYFDNYVTLPILILFGVTIGFLAGIYPAFVLSSFKPVAVLKGQKMGNRKGLNIRNGLVFIQYVVSIFLIIGLIIIYKQSNLLFTKNLGYDKDNLLIVKDGSTKRTSVRDKKEIFRADLIRLAGIEDVTFTNRIIPSGYNMLSNEWIPENGNPTLFAEMRVDPDYLKTMKLQLAAGRFFSNETSTDSSMIVINEAAAKLINGKNPVGVKLNNGESSCQVIGVVKDFNYELLHNEIKPLIMFYHGGKIGYTGSCDAIIRYNPNNLESIIGNIENLWKEYVPLNPLEYYILAEKNKTFYRKEGQTSNLMLVLTLLVVFVTTVGLFGLAIFSAEEKRKEIAIRKAIGASVSGIIFKMTWNFTKLVLIANIVAWPLAWYFMNDWLSGFATRINISWWIFVLAALLSYLLAIATIIFQAFSAARKNPVEVLRYE